MPRSKQDPLIGALIAKLPKLGEEWPVDQQIGWLRLMAMAFGNVYGGEAAMILTNWKESRDPVAAAVTTALTAMPTRVSPLKPTHRFVIDEQGYAKNAQGKRVMPKDCGAVPIFDMRGQDGDMRTIVWADDSKGLNGADLVITA